MPRKCPACRAGLRAPLSAQRGGCGARRVLPSGTGAVMETAPGVPSARRGSRGLNVSIKTDKQKKTQLMLALNKERPEAREEPEESQACVAKNKSGGFPLQDEHKNE